MSWDNTDNVTGLMWLADALDEGCFSGGSEQWAVMIGWAEDLSFSGYSDWRTPNVHEFISLVNMEPSGSGAKINQTYFLNTQNSYYWTSTDTPGSYYKFSSKFLLGQDYDSGQFNLL